MVQVNAMAKHRSQVSDTWLDEEQVDDGPSKAAAKIAAAKMLFKRRLFEQMLEQHKYETGKEWAVNRIAEGKKDLDLLSKKELVSTKSAQQRKDAAKEVWTKAASAMLDAENEINAAHPLVAALDINKVMADADKNAEDALNKVLSKEVLEKKHQAAQTAAVAEVTADDLAEDKAYLKKIDLDREASMSFVDTQVLAEEDIIMEKALAEKKNKKAKDASLLELETHLTTENQTELTMHNGNIWELSVKSNNSNVASVLEDVGDLADRTRMTLYGGLSERAVQLAAAKMIYKKQLFMEKVAAEDSASAKKHAKSKIQEGKTSLKTVANNKRVAAKATAKKVNDARAQWEALVPEMKELASAKDADKQKTDAEDKAEDALTKTLEKEEKAVFVARVSKRSIKEIQSGQEDGTTDKDGADSRADAEWKAMEAKVNAEMESQEKIIEKKIHTAVK